MKKFLRLVPFLLIHACGCPGLAQTYVEKQEIDAYNLLKNPGFENGLVGWTRGAGCSTNSPAPLSGSRNGNCTGTGSAETKWEQTVSVAEYRPYVGKTFKASCNITTISSSMQFCGLFNGAETCIPVAESASLSAAGYTEYAVPVSIPADQASSFTAGIRIKTTGSGVFGTRVDNCYLGPWKGVVGLVPTSTEFGAKVSSTGVLSDIVNGKYINGTTFAPTDTSRFDIAFQGLTSAPNCEATVTTSTTSGNAIVKKETTETNSSAQFRTGNSTTASNFTKTAYGFSFRCKLTGQDYANAATVTNVVGLVPKETVFSARISDGNPSVVSKENVDWIEGNCPVTGTSVRTCTFKSGFFSSPPTCTATVVVASGMHTVRVSGGGPTASAIELVTYAQSGSQSMAAFELHCQRSDSDYTSTRKSYDNLPFAPMESGSWTPTISSGTNLTSSSVLGAIYMRMGDVVFGSITMDVTAASTTTTSFRFSLPITPVGFTSTSQLIGSGGAWNGNMIGNASSVNSTTFGFYTFLAGTTASRTHNFNFSYRLK